MNMNYENEIKEDFILVKSNTIKKLQHKGVTNYGAVLLYCKILTLSIKGKCTASNAYFADVLGTTTRNIQKYLLLLKEKEIVKVYEEKNGSHTEARYIYPQQLDTAHPTQPTNDCSSVPPDPRTNGSQPTNDCSSTHEHLGHNPRTNGHPNNRREENIIEENREGSLRSLDASHLSSFGREKNLSFDGMIDDSMIPDIIDKTFLEYIEDGLSLEDVRDKLINTFTSGYYQCKNINSVASYVDSLFYNNN